MDGGPSHYETFDPKPGAPAEIRGKFDADRHQGPRRPVLGAHEAAGGDRRQAGDRPLDPPRPGEPRRGQPLHDDRRPAADPGRLRRVRQLPPQPRARSPRTSAGPRAGCRRTSRCPSMSRSGGPNFLGAKYAPFVVPDNPNRTDFRVRDVAPPARPDRRPVRPPPRPPRPRRPLPADHRQGRRRPGRGARRVLRAGLRPDVARRRPSGLRHRPRARHASATPTAATRSASGACWPAGWSRPACRSSRSTRAAGTTTIGIFDGVRQADARRSRRRSPR